MQTLHEFKHLFIPMNFLKGLPIVIVGSCVQDCSYANGHPILLKGPCFAGPGKATMLLHFCF